MFSVVDFFVEKIIFLRICKIARMLMIGRLVTAVLGNGQIESIVPLHV